MCMIKSRAGGELQKEVCENLQSPNRFDILVRTPDHRLVLWFHGQKKLTIDQAIDIAEEIPQMEFGWVVVCIKEV